MIEIKNMKKSYGNRDKEFIALDNVSLKIEDNEIVGLLGPNGAGKTTLIKSVCGLVKPEQGEIYIDDVWFTEKNHFKMIASIGSVLEGARNLFWRLTVKQNFEYLAMQKNVGKKKIADNTKYFANVFEIEELLDKPVYKLSLGQKQLVAIIACLIYEPSILLLDEPSNGLDVEYRDLLVKILRKVRNIKKTSVVITSHDSNFISKVADNFYVIKDGNILFEFQNENYTSEALEEKYKQLVGEK